MKNIKLYLNPKIKLFTLKCHRSRELRKTLRKTMTEDLNSFSWHSSLYSLGPGHSPVSILGLTAAQLQPDLTVMLYILPVLFSITCTTIVIILSHIIIITSSLVIICEQEKAVRF